jgi:hypothetical protein
MERTPVFGCERIIVMWVKQSTGKRLPEILLTMSRRLQMMELSKYSMGIHSRDSLKYSSCVFLKIASM